MRRLLYLLFVLVWIVAMTFPTAAVVLAVNKQFTIGSTRVFLLQQRDAVGVGVQTARPAANDVDCRRNTVRYFLVEGDAENASTCLCNDGVPRVPDGRLCIAP